MKRVHRMPFGAHLDENGQAHFRLWAPSAKSVTLQVRAFERAQVSMTRGEGGWCEAVLPNAHPGMRYSYRIDDELDVPDPASRFNPDGVHGASVLVQATEFRWQDTDWHGHAWHELVIHELHVGTFTTQGTYAGIVERLPDLAQLGVTAIELLPLASFSGARGWGYDGVLPYAPHPSYGTPEDLKMLIQRAHEHNLSVLLDVVYNHFGPDGNYLGRYARDFFTGKHSTPWGDAIDFSQPTVRQFFIQNALYWLNEYHFDGLRIDAVHAMYDDGPKHFIDELIDAVQDGPGRERQVHIVLENHHNEARRLRRPRVSQWNDDFHHALHVLLTGETEGYYADFAERPLEQLGRSLAEGFAFQGELSRASGEHRGEASVGLAPLAFVNFLQNHDQVGNRALGERLAALSKPEPLKGALAILLLAPQLPMLFMGEEYAAAQPFLYFCDYTGVLASAVREGRRAEFSGFGAFSDESLRERIPDPNAVTTFEQSGLVWSQRHEPQHRIWLDYVTTLLHARRRAIVQLIPDIEPGASRYELERNVLNVRWPLKNGGALQMSANLSNEPAVQSTSRPPHSMSPPLHRGGGLGRGQESGQRSLVFSSSDEPSPDALAPWEVRVFAPERRA